MCRDQILKLENMSRIGKKPVVIPSGITVTVGTDNTVTVKGPKGELKQTIDRDIKVEVKDNKIEISRPTDQIRHRALAWFVPFIIIKYGEGCYGRIQKTTGTYRCWF